MNLLAILFSCMFVFLANAKTIVLHPNNTLTIRGTISQETADTFLYDALLHNKSSETVIYINSQGGSVLAGNRIIEFIESRNFTCIAEKAYSMAFVILQACQKRYILKSSIVMQHQQYLGLDGELYKINSYLKLVNTIESSLNTMQSNRLGMDEKTFTGLISNEWWLYGNDILAHKVADEFVTVDCSRELVKKHINVTEIGLFNNFKETYSACPLILTPIS